MIVLLRRLVAPFVITRIMWASRRDPKTWEPL